jgi:hypothetical protein
VNKYIDISFIYGNAFTEEGAKYIADSLKDDEYGNQ